LAAHHDNQTTEEQAAEIEAALAKKDHHHFRSVSPGAGQSPAPGPHKLYCEALTGVADPVTT
jgi:hypothetical protein